MFYGEETKLGTHEEMSFLLKKHCSDSYETMFRTSLDIPTCKRFPELEFAAEGNIVWLQWTMFGRELPTTSNESIPEATSLSLEAI